MSQKLPMLKYKEDYITNGIDGLSYETTLIVFKNQLLTISFKRGGFKKNGNPGIIVRDFKTKTILQDIDWVNGGVLGTAIVADGVIHIFGTTHNGQNIVHSVLDLNFVPSLGKVVYTNNITTLYNVGICFNGDKYVMLVETQARNHQAVFLTATDLINWELIGSLTTDAYFGGPKILYVDGVYYMTCLKSAEALNVSKIQFGGSHTNRLSLSSHLHTTIARSTDLQAFIFSKFSIITPIVGEGSNNSDLTMVEFENVVYGLYLDGDQTTYANLRCFTYAGTMTNFIKEFF